MEITTTRVPQPTDPQVLADRESNRKIVEAYLAITGTDAAVCEKRLALMHEEIMYEINMTMDCVPHRYSGLSYVRERFALQEKCWKEFAYTNVKIMAVDDPALFLVECDGVGKMFSPIFQDPLRPYQNVYNIIFNIRDGKIWELRQFANPYKLMNDFWKTLPDRAL